MSEKLISDTVAVYRIENPTIAAKPNGVTSHEDLVGQWFSPNLPTVLNYLDKATKLIDKTKPFGQRVSPAEGAQLVVAQVPTDQLEDLHVSNHPVAATMDVESDNYIVPRDGSIDTQVLPLDDVLGDLRGQLSNWEKQKQAHELVTAHVGEAMLAHEAQVQTVGH